jgi:hypothetical protein
LDLRVNLKPSPGPIPQQRRIARVGVSTSGPVSVAFTILSFHYTLNLAQGLGGGCSEPRDVDLSSNATRQEARHASHEETWAREESERDWRAVGWAAKRRGIEASPRSTFSGEGVWKEG